MDEHGFFRKTALATILCLCSYAAFCRIDSSGIYRIIKDIDACTGVAVRYGDRTFAMSESDDERFPLMSTFKHHVCVTALKKMEKENIALDSTVTIGPEHMYGNTYSPLRERYPDSRISITYGELIRYTMSFSDNNTCDWLIGFVGGIDNVDRYIRSLGITGFRLSETEYSMHEDIMRSYRNWSTPLAMVELLEKIHSENILAEEHLRFLEKTMIECESGKDKLKAGLPAEVIIGHKTGHSDRTAEGIRIAETDAGVIYMPDGSKCYIAVFIKDSEESDADNAKIMADIAKAVFRSIQ